MKNPPKKEEKNYRKKDSTTSNEVQWRFSNNGESGEREREN